MSFSQKITALTAAFVAEVVCALRAVPIQELAALSGRPFTAQAGSAPGSRESPARPPARPVRAKAASARPKASADPETARAAAPPDPHAVQAALDFFVNRGARGATGVQVLEHLRTNGFEDGGADVMTELAARGAIRDAGIRRATGKGTAPVFVTTATS